jgi:hypothetical protein
MSKEKAVVSLTIFGTADNGLLQFMRSRKINREIPTFCLSKETC